MTGKIVFLIFLLAAFAAVTVALVIRIGDRRATGHPESAAATTDTDSHETMDITDNVIKTEGAEPAIAAFVPADSELISLSGGASHGSLTAETGTRSDIFNVIDFNEKGASAEFTVDMSSPEPRDPGEPVVIAIREIHRENEEVFAYTVSVDGRDVYFRTYGQIASAPNVLYVLVPRKDIIDLKNVTVGIASGSGAVFSISDVTVYTRLFEANRASGADDRLGIYLHSSDSVEKAYEHINDFKGFSFDLYRLGLLFKIDYMNKTPDEITSSVIRMLNAAGENGWDIQLMPTVYWGQPNLPDGQSGMMTDAKYQQIAFNSLDGRYYGSVPNVYGSTVWITSASDVLNGAFTSKIESVFKRIGGIVGQARANGRFDGRVAVVIEHGVCYKGPESSVGVTFNALDCADFGPLMKALAAADGVDLDPTDGLSRTEKLWMIKHHADYFQELADAYNNALGSDPIIVSGANVRYPTEQTADNLLTHGVQWTERSPAYGDMLASGWKSGVGDGMYSSSEDMWWDDPRFYQYKAAYGRIGTVNFEVSYSRSTDLTGRRGLLRKAYELGFEYLTLFNDSTSYGTAKIIADLDSIGNEKATYTVNHYDVPLLDANFNRDVSVGDWKKIYGVTESANAVYDTKNGVLRVGNPAEPGHITFKVAADGVSENGLKLHIESMRSGGRVRICVDGATLGEPGTGEQTNYVNRFVSNDYDVRDVTKGKTSCEIRIELTGNATVRAVAVYDTFGTNSGQLNGVSLTRAQARVLALNTEREALARNMLSRYMDKRGINDDTYSVGRSLIGQGSFVTAYGYLSQRLSETLPATFTVKKNGFLGGLDIYAETGGTNPLSVTVLSKDKTSASFSFFTGFASSSSASREMTLTVRGLSDGNYDLNETSFNEYVLKKSESGTIPSKDGAVRFTVTVKYGSAASFETPGTITGRVLVSGGTSVTIMTRDLRAAEYSPKLQFSFSESCAFSRRADGSDVTEPKKPEPGDFVVLTLSQDGTVVRADSAYGRKTGVITSYTPPDFSDPDTPNGIITFGDGSFELEYLSYTTEIISDGVKKYARAFTDDELSSLFAGSTASIEYCPEFYGERYRVQKITIEQRGRFG